MGGSFIAKADLRNLRHIARHRQKLGGMLASEKNRLHKLLTDAGIRLGVVVSDLHGQSARAMVKALIAGKTVPEVLELASHRLRASRQDIFEALQAEAMTAAHRFVLSQQASARVLVFARARLGSDACCASLRRLRATSRCALKDKFQALSVRKGHKRSIVALAHKMLRTIYAMLSKNTHYVDKAVDDEALMVAQMVMCHAPRWRHMLVKHWLR